MNSAFTKQLLTFLLFSLIYIEFGYGQNAISGVVQDESGQGLSFANILLLNPADSLLIKGSVSDVDGQYLIEDLVPGKYILSTSMIGYVEQYSSPFTLSSQEAKKEMSPIILIENIAQLNEVQVVAKKALFEQKIDRMVVNVAASITSAGSTALEVLQRSPGVLANAQTGTLSMSGKDGVIVMINGKISRMPLSAVVQMLDGMPSDNVEKIELIHTPPANFDAEGNAGFINIVLKKNTNEGINGSFTLNAGYGKKEKFGASTNFNYRKNKVNLFGDYSWNYNHNPQRFVNYRSIEQEGKVVETLSESFREPTRLHIQNARLGLDYELNKKTIIGGLVGWMNRSWTMDAINEITITEDNIPIEFIDIPNTEDNDWQHLLGNINLQHQLDESQKLNFDFDYAYYYFDNPSNYENQFFDSNRNLTSNAKLRVDKTTPMHILVGKIDYSKSINKNLSLETGVKGVLTRFDNDIKVENLIQDVWTIDPIFSSNVRMEEDIAAAYSSLSWKVDDKTDIKLGLRYEFTSTNLGSETQANIVDRNYDNLFPSLFVARKINDNNQIQLSYSRRINRPDFTQLAPFFIFYDPTTILTGNPQLQPSITDAANLNYIWKTFQLSLQYSIEDNAIGRFQPQVDTETNTQVNGAKNFDNIKSASITLSFPFHPTKWWELRVNATGGWQQVNDVVDNQPLQVENKRWNLNVSQNFKFPKDFSVEMNGFYSSKALFGIIEFRPYKVFNIGIQKVLNNNKGTLRFNVQDVFESGIWKVQSQQTSFFYRGEYDIAERVFRLTYTKNFGNNKLKGSRKRATGSEEERRRVN